MGRAMESNEVHAQPSIEANSPTPTPTKARASMFATVFGSRAIGPTESDQHMRGTNHPQHRRGALREPKEQPTSVVVCERQALPGPRTPRLQIGWLYRDICTVGARLIHEWKHGLFPSRCGLTPEIVCDLVFLAENPQLEVESERARMIMRARESVCVRETEGERGREQVSSV
ncbi:hypothetical protein PybrP1_011027 [[Pythium] brassicae (nom. inval.)]|nr:hypothetical protein PybrP1_011027 [[Pythium] brassicae (nom. inval.)]